jgi:hypothetical protein
VTLSAEQFEPELRAALRSYERHIVCLEQLPDEAEESLRSLLAKAIRAYENREPGLRHGIALNRQITIILSQTETDRPLCGIYFNLHSPYSRKSRAKSDAGTRTEPPSDG